VSTRSASNVSAALRSKPYPLNPKPFHPSPFVPPPKPSPHRPSLPPSSLPGFRRPHALALCECRRIKKAKILMVDWEV
jgi:hypothetical protein